MMRFILTGMLYKYYNPSITTIRYNINNIITKLPVGILSHKNYYSSFDISKTSVSSHYKKLSYNPIRTFSSESENELSIVTRQDQIINKGECVYRPSGNWTKDVHKFLGYLHDKGFDATPKPLGFDKTGREIVSFIKGEVSNYPLSKNASSIQALTSAAILLRKYHDISMGFLDNNNVEEKPWQLPYRYPIEVICHGDYAPYNVVLNGKQAVGIIDFDTAHPGPRTWDIAYALYRWAPLTNPNNHDGFGHLKSQVARAALFCDSYGLPIEKRINMAALIIERLQSLVNFMYKEAEEGNETMKTNIADGHHLLYIEDIEYIKTHSIFIDNQLCEYEPNVIGVTKDIQDS